MLSFRRLLPFSRALTRLPAGAPQRAGFRWKSTTTTTGSQSLGAVLRPTAIDFAVRIHMTDAGNVSTEAMQKTLKQALGESEELRADVEKLIKKARKMNAQMMALGEKVEKLVKVRDNYKEHPDEVKERHKTQLREMSEEMNAAAARFSEKEWREHCDQVEAEVRRLQKTVNVCMPAALAHLPHEEEEARRGLQDEEEAQSRDLQGPQWEASLKEVSAREAARAEAVFAARGLSMTKLRRTHLGKGHGTEQNSYAAGEGLYKLLLALRRGGPVDRFAMRELLKDETTVTHLWYETQRQGNICINEHFTIPAAHAYELAACVLCHLPALRELTFQYLPPLSSHSLEWVSYLPQCMKRLSFWYTGYTVADLREMHRRRGSHTFRVYVEANSCTDWGEFEDAGEVNTKKTLVNEELGGMVDWY